MKKSVLFTLIFIFIFILSFVCLSEVYAIEGPRNGKLLVTLKDNLNDDNGPGTYIYPLGRKYRSSAGMFDIREIKIYEVGNYYRFDIEFKGKILRTWPGEPAYQYGWLLNVMEIYIDMDHRWGSGHKNALMGRNLIFNPESAWEKVIFICPVNEDTVRNAVREKTDDLEFAESLKDFIFPINVDVYDNALAVTVKKSDVGNYSNKWGFQALSTVLDNSSSYMTFFNKVIKMNPSDDEFGGASNYYGAPNVLDILTPPGTSQKEILSKYYAHPNPGFAKFAKISCVYNDNALPEIDKNSKIIDNEELKISHKEKLMKESDKKYELALNEEIPKNVFEVKERVIENKNKAVKNKVPNIENESEENIKFMKASSENSKNKPENIEPKSDTEKKYERAYSVSAEKYEAAELAAEKLKLSEVNKNNDTSKQNKNKADSNKKGKDGISSDKYDEFMAKLERQKLDVKIRDDENAFDGVEDFLKKETKVERKKASRTSKKAEEGQFNKELYEIAKTTDEEYPAQNIKKASRPGKKDILNEISSEAKKENINNANDSSETVLMSGLDNNKAAAAEVKNNTETAAEPEQEDKSIIGRLFKKNKPKNKRPQIVEIESKKEDAAETKRAASKENKIDDTKIKSKSQKSKVQAGVKNNINLEDTGDIKAAKALIEGDNQDNSKVCAGNMKLIKTAAKQYIEKNPEALRISMNMLVSGGYLAGPLKCPDGGRYLIEISSGKVEITCINVNNTGHGKY